MKKITISFIIAAFAGLFITSCHDLDVDITTQLTPSVYPTDSTEFVSVAGVVYTALRGNYASDYFFIQTLTTDEAILPARGGNWYDSRGYLVLHYHNWNLDRFTYNWNWISTIIGYSNQVLDILQQTMPEGNTKNTTLAEIKMVRAFAYFMFMDGYGNVPLDTLYGDYTPHKQASRTETFNFIENSVKSCIPYLSTTTGSATYGRPTRYMAYALLAKMYINSEYYTGVKRYDDCIKACNEILTSGKFMLEPKDSYLRMFYPDNGPGTREFIFAIPYDPNTTNIYNGYNYRARYEVPRSLRAKFNLPFTPSAAESTIPEFYAYFNDPNDVRNKQWLTGKQYLNDGVTPIMVTTTNKGYNQFYTGADGSASYTYQVELTPNIVLRQDSASFDVGNDEIAWNMGYRNIKMYPDASSANRNQNNDFPVFRLSDIYLMKAEAIQRGGTSSDGSSALSLMNELRSYRTTSPAWNNCNLDSIYNERCREMAFENWHRNDMIRFGRFEGKWGFKTDNDINRRLFPIPPDAIKKNPNLVQNPGY
jgi:hypothetical protein